MTEVIRHDKVEVDSFADVSQRFQERQGEGSDFKNRVEFTFMATPLISLISDWHIGHPTTNYKRIEDEVNAVMGTANSFVVLLGDEINNMNWNPGQMEEMEQTPEQIMFYWAVVKELAAMDKLLLRVPGDHDGWLKRQGFDLSMLVREEGVNTTSGPTHLIANVGVERYVAFLAHQLPGFSMYNRNHPQMRSERFGEGRGSDVIASGHNHQKQISEGFAHAEEGETGPITYISLGSYKPTDGWLQKRGYPVQNPTPDEMFGAAILLDGKVHKVYASNDIVQSNYAVRELRKEDKKIERMSPLDIGFYDSGDNALWWEMDAERPE